MTILQGKQYMLTGEKVFKVTKYFELSYAHRLHNYPGKCGNIHGHTAKIKVTCEVKELPPTGMAIDFRELKQKIGGYIDTELDHRIILAKSDPITEVLIEHGEDVIILEVPPSAENLAKLIFEKVEEFGLPVTKVSFWESPTSRATYQSVASEQ